MKKRSTTMPSTRVTSKHQITIPREVFTSAGLEVGDILEATVNADGILLKPKRLVDEVRGKLTAVREPRLYSSLRAVQPRGNLGLGDRDYEIATARPCRVGAASYPAAPLTEPDLWTSHPALWVSISRSNNNC